MSIEFKFLVGPETTSAEQQLPVGQQVTWPFDSIVLYAFENDRVIGRIGVMAIRVIEGTWAEPGHTTLAPRLMKQLEAFLKSLGSTHAAALVYDEQPQVAEYLKRIDFKRFPVTMFIKDLV